MMAYGGGRSGRIHRNVQEAVAPREPELTKMCAVCERVLPLSAFHKMRGGLFGRQSQCKPCQANKTAASRAGKAVVA